MHSAKHTINCPTSTTFGEHCEKYCEKHCGEIKHQHDYQY